MDGELAGDRSSTPRLIVVFLQPGPAHADECREACMAPPSGACRVRSARERLRGEAAAGSVERGMNRATSQVLRRIRAFAADRPSASYDGGLQVDCLTYGSWLSLGQSSAKRVQ